MERFHFSPLRPSRPPTPPASTRTVWHGRPRQTMTHTSETEFVAISSLKHLSGSPLGSPTTLVGPWARRYALLAVAYRRCPRNPSRAPRRRPRGGAHGGARAALWWTKASLSEGISLRPTNEFGVLATGMPAFGLGNSLWWCTHAPKRVSKVCWPRNYILYD